MIVEFRTSNYLSFGELAEFSMVASADKTNENDNVFKFDNLRILKSAVVYGANGSGKTNFYNAFSYMRLIILGHEKMEDHSFKLNKSTHTKPSYFEVIFYNSDNKRYRYGFEIDEKAVVSEWLFYTPNTRETKLFTRSRQNITLGASFKEGKGLETKTKESRLFISVVSELNGKISESVIEWFRRINAMSGLYSSNYDTLRLLGKSDKYKKHVLNILHSFDIQMEDFVIKEKEFSPIEIPDNKSMPKGLKKLLKTMNDYLKNEKIDPPPQVIIKRRAYESGKAANDVEFDLLDNESDGIKKLFSLSGYLVQALEEGHTLFIDELESKLHPLITKEIVKIFNSKENKKNAQLIFTTHDTNLLRGGHFRRDQIWFTEKDKFGCSHLYSLAEYKIKPRKDASFEKDYIRGRYGAIPFIGDFLELTKG